MSICTVLVNYNNFSDTSDCINSIIADGHGKYIVVVDNNSTSSGLEDIRNLFPCVHIIANNENVGFGKANNIGINWALNNTSCDFIFILNNDTILEPGSVDLLLQAMSLDPYVALSTPKIVFEDNPDILWYGGGEIDWKKGVGVVPGYLGPKDSQLALKQRYVTFASGCAMMFRRSALEKFRGFDPRYFMYCEDVEFCVRVHKAGQKILYVPTAMIRHRCGGSQRRRGEQFWPMLDARNKNLDFYLYHMTKNRLLLIHDHAIPRDRLRFLLYFPIYMSYKSATYVLRLRFSALLAIVKAVHDYFIEVRTSSTIHTEY